jgi:hypothetical protein
LRPLPISEFSLCFQIVPLEIRLKTLEHCPGPKLLEGVSLNRDDDVHYELIASDRRQFPKKSALSFGEIPRAKDY